MTTPKTKKTSEAKAGKHNNKTVKLKASVQIDGKADKEPTRKAYGSLDHILGEKLSTYSVDNVADYEDYVTNLNKTDLQTHALKVGLIPLEDRQLLTSRLIREFQVAQGKFAPRTEMGGVKSPANLTKEVQRILREGA